MLCKRGKDAVCKHRDWTRTKSELAVGLFKLDPYFLIQSATFVSLQVDQPECL